MWHVQISVQLMSTCHLFYFIFIVVARKQISSIRLSQRCFVMTLDGVSLNVEPISHYAITCTLNLFAVCAFNELIKWEDPETNVYTNCLPKLKIMYSFAYLCMDTEQVQYDYTIPHWNMKGLDSSQLYTNLNTKTSTTCQQMCAVITRGPRLPPCDQVWG